MEEMTEDEMKVIRRLDVQIKVLKVIFMIVLGILSVMVGYAVHDYIRLSQPVKVVKKVEPVPHVSLGNEEETSLSDPGANAAQI